MTTMYRRAARKLKLIEEVIIISRKQIRTKKIIAFLLGAALAASMTYYIIPEKEIIVKVDTYTGEEHRLIDKISMSYKVPPEVVSKIYSEAKEQTKDLEYPKVHDVMAIIAIESGFRSNVVSSAGAGGLMQILYKRPTFDIKQNLKDGISLLVSLKQTLRGEPAIIHSYNVGIGNYHKGHRNNSYYIKFKQKQKEFKEILL